VVREINQRIIVSSPSRLVFPLALPRRRAALLTTTTTIIIIIIISNIINSRTQVIAIALRPHPSENLW